MSLPFKPFAIVAEDFILLPSPLSGHVEAYRRLFQTLHADAQFCLTAFGDSFPVPNWSDEQVKHGLLVRDGGLRWGRRGMGDFALAFIPEQHKHLFPKSKLRMLRTTEQEAGILEGTALEELLKQENGQILEQLDWAGYTCVRDATTSSLEDIIASLSPQEKANYPDWKDMIEVRYGLSPEFRGRGVITRAMLITMRWAEEERGVTRFIAEAQQLNSKSGHVLTRLGLKKRDTNYFQEEGIDEWST